VANRLDLRRSVHAQTFREAAGRPIDPTNGTAQIPSGNVVAAQAYGAWRALSDLYGAFGLPPPATPRPEGQ
jgi:hypothetical protein